MQTHILEEGQKGTLTPEVATKATKVTLGLLGNAAAHQAKERRTNVLKDMNKDVMPLAEEDDQFKDAAPLLFGEGFKKKMKDHVRHLGAFVRHFGTFIVLRLPLGCLRHSPFATPLSLFTTWVPLSFSVNQLGTFASSFSVRQLGIFVVLRSTPPSPFATLLSMCRNHHRMPTPLAR